IILNGNGDWRGMPEGRQLALGSSFDNRSLLSLRAQGCKGSFSPGLRATAISPINLDSGPQIPDRSGLPSAARGAGPEDFALSFSRLAMGTPPPAGLIPGGSGWALAEGRRCGEDQKGRHGKRGHDGASEGLFQDWSHDAPPHCSGDNPATIF